ncbi:MAG: endonuclease III [Kofleriaceae bacterium]|nr:endonuclease III [Kofleriaceae bacterium]
MTASDSSVARVPTKLAERAARIKALLDQYIPDAPVPLHHDSPFQLLCAVLLSAQCTDDRVNLVTPALFNRAPTAAALAQLDTGDILPIIRSCGLAPTKAKNLAALGRMLVANYGGDIPHELAQLEQLPGVGHKTASVVVAQAFGEPAFPVDTHIHRLAGRWQLSRARNVAEVERDLKRVFPRATWNKLHLQFIYFGRQHCPARGHVPTTCAICSWAMSKARARLEAQTGTSKPNVSPR